MPLSPLLTTTRHPWKSGFPKASLVRFSSGGKGLGMRLCAEVEGTWNPLKGTRVCTRDFPVISSSRLEPAGNVGNLACRRT